MTEFEKELQQRVAYLTGKCCERCRYLEVPALEEPCRRCHFGAEGLAVEGYPCFVRGEAKEAAEDVED